ncbi:MAG: ATP-dependent RecD-like DNA helicase [Candidatus Atribacteria bacterium]|nr:ATP-dependent RecD-like DNA helicase [Candidatus Atribacteria bacterium]
MEIQGQVERITYHNEENGYTIARMKVPGNRELITIVGNVLSIIPGEILKLRGEWKNHPKYGEQFLIESYQSVTPASVKGVEKYLGSGLIKGIGPIMAKRLVNKFGTNTLKIIEKDIQKLQEVEGIGAKRIAMIKKAWDEQKDIRNVMIFLQEHGVSPSYAVKIYKQYGQNSIKTVQENPYRLATDIFGIGFITADRIAQKLGLPKDAPARIEAGILYTLNKFAENGHVYVPTSDLLSKCQEILDVEENEAKKALFYLSQQNSVFIEKISDHEEGVYLTPFHVAETGIVTMLKALIKFPKTIPLFGLGKTDQIVSKELGINLDESQQQALHAALSEKVLVITGGPGTGKTTLIKAIICLYKKMGYQILLAAPTGRAAKRMTEATGFEAKTLHRLLEYSPKDNQFKKNHENPLNADVLIIDETSMIDTILMFHFLKAIPPNATLILVGDVDQLPSVGAGNLLHDLIESEVIPTVRLTKIFRQAQDSLIILNAHRINHGQFPILDFSPGKLQDFYFFPCNEPEKALQIILDLCCHRIPKTFGFHPLEHIQVLSPMHRGLVGAANLNIELQKSLNPSSKTEINRGGNCFRIGDKVMQIRNNYNKDIYNGDIGKIIKIDREIQEITINFDGKEVNYEFSELDEIVLSYAISIHKSQGSEYPAIVIPLLTQHYMMLQRNLLYTAITRGKKLVVLVGNKKAIAIAVRNNQPLKRYTQLKTRLQDSFNSNK